MIPNRNKKRNRRNRNQRNAMTNKRRQSISEKQLQNVVSYFDHMRLNLQRIITNAPQLTRDECNDDNPLYTAIVKWMENICESATKIDEISPLILAKLTELPGSEWKDLKGMRTVLAHSFRTIDADIVWGAMHDEVPKLQSLLERFQVHDKLMKVNTQGLRGFDVDPRKFCNLPNVPDEITQALLTSENPFKPGESMLYMIVGSDNNVEIVRLGFIQEHENTLVISSSAGQVGSNLLGIQLGIRK